MEAWAWAIQGKSYSPGEHEGSAQRKPQIPARWGWAVGMQAAAPVACSFVGMGVHEQALPLSLLAVGAIPHAARIKLLCGVDSGIALAITRYVAAVCFSEFPNFSTR